MKEDLIFALDCLPEAITFLLPIFLLIINFLLDNPLLSSIYILGGLFITLFIILVIIVIIRAYKEIY